MSQLATFAGCFWGVEAAFRQVSGVLKTQAGYTGGSGASPTYEQVCTGSTGHAESVEVEFDPEIVSYEELLGHFWQLHDPTQLNRQGPDRGTQYRSAIYYHSGEQQAAAQRSKDELTTSNRFKDPIVTEVTGAAPFYGAEDYHQQYLEKRGMSTCTPELAA